MTLLPLQSTGFDKAVAFVLSFRLPVLILLTATLVIAFFVTFYFKDQYIQNWTIEIFGAMLLFLAVLRVNPTKISSFVFLILLVVGVALGIGSYIYKENSPLDALLIEASAAFLLFVFLEVVMRRIIENAAAREALIQQKIQEARQRALNKAQDYFESVRLTGPISDILGQAAESYSDAMTKQIFGEDFQPGIQQFVPDDPAWESLWLQSDQAPKD